MSTPYSAATTLPDERRLDPAAEPPLAQAHAAGVAPHPPAATSGSVEVAGASRRRVPRAVIVTLVVLAILLLLAIIAGLLSRAADERALARRTTLEATPTVAVTHPAVSHLTPEIALPGNTQAFVDTPIYARTNGYLKKWYFDIGAHVRKGQLMATIETPEVDQQLQVAQADLRSARANLGLAETTAKRYQDLLKLDSVSKQETDQATSDALARRAAVEAAEAAVRRLEQLQSFERIYAPFDGIVTARNTDIGALIDAGSGSAQPRDLFRLAAIGQIRVFVAVPEVYANDIVAGGKAYLTLDEFPNRRFEGVVARNSSAIDPNTRTLNVEVDVPNTQGLLLPGSYVFVHFATPRHSGTLSLPANTLLFRAQGLQVATVRNDRVHLVPITITHDNGSSVEIQSTLTASDPVILDPSDSISEGQEVHVAAPSTSNGAPAA